MSAADTQGDRVRNRLRLPTRRPGAAAALTTGAGLAVWALLLNLHGFWPGRSQPTLMTLHGAGVIQCLHDQGISSLWNNCHALGAPEGLPLLTGLPQIYLGWVIGALPGVDSWAAHQISNALVTGLGLLAGYLLLRRWSAPRWIALLTSALYLASPSVLAMNGFAYTFSGFVLLPAYLLATLVVVDLVVARRLVLAGALALVLTFVMVFTDGYSMFAGVLMAGAVVLARCWDRALSWRTRGLVVAVPGVALVLAVLAFLAYTPDNVTEIPVGIGAFRYLGLDLATLVLPQDTLWWADAAGFERLTGVLWGDGSNVVANYVGLSTLVLAVVSLALGRQRSGERRVVVALTLAGLVALVLALGPALKVYSLTESVLPAWDVPESGTLGDLPTAWVYENVPGFEAMRATYRWFLLTRFVLVLLAGLGLTAVWRHRPRGGRRVRLWRGVAVAAAVLLVAETAPNVPNALASTTRWGQNLAETKAGVISDAGSLVRPGERILILPTRNDFLAIGLVPFTAAVAYNAAPDKNYTFARAAWPDSVEAAAVAWTADDEARADAICRVLQSDADAVVLPYLDPYYDAVSWPPPEQRVASYREVADRLAVDDRFVAERGTWMTVLRGAGRGC